MKGTGGNFCLCAFVSSRAKKRDPLCLPTSCQWQLRFTPLPRSPIPAPFDIVLHGA